VYFSPVGEGLWEIAARAWHDPSTHSASKVSWGVPVANAHVESHFTVSVALTVRMQTQMEKLITRQEYLPQIREALARVPDGGWREFAAFAGPELETLVAWDNKIVLVGDSSHALSGAFGSGAGFAMEDGWILAQSLACFDNDLSKALPLFDQIRLSYYARMYTHLASEATRRAKSLQDIGSPSFDERVANKIISVGGADMSWIYQNDIEATWTRTIEDLGPQP
jgi:salicylate hydroxylase